MKMLPLTELERRLRMLTNTCEHLPDRLRSAARQLRESGTTPVPSEIDVLRQVRQLQQELDLALPSTSAGDVQSCVTLASLAERYQCLAELESAFATLQELMELQHVVPESQALLQPIQEEAEQLRTNLRQNPTSKDAEAFRQRAHPIVKLMQLVQASSELSDDEWDAAFHVVAEKYGRAVAVAAARQRIERQPQLNVPVTENNDHRSNINEFSPL